MYGNQLGNTKNKRYILFDLLCSEGGEEIDILLYLLRIQRRHRHLAPVINNAAKVRIQAREVLASRLCVTMVLDGLNDLQESFSRHIITASKLTVDVGQQLKYYINIKLSEYMDEFKVILIDKVLPKD